MRLLALQRPPGSEDPAGTGVQVPAWPLTLQLRQRPLEAAEQLVSQHTPSTQLPLSHWAAEEQTLPLPFLPQRLLTQVFGLTHWVSLVQLVRHSPVLLSQVKAPHCTDACPGQASPRPSQNAADSEVAEPEHEGALHWLVV